MAVLHITAFLTVLEAASCLLLQSNTTVVHNDRKKKQSCHTVDYEKSLYDSDISILFLPQKWPSHDMYYKASIAPAMHTHTKVQRIHMKTSDTLT